MTKEFAVTSGAILRQRIGTLHAVSGVELAVRRGETFGLVGESGCGKTTLGRIGVALELPTSGQVVFNGVDLGTRQGRPRSAALRQDLQFMFQDPYASLDPRMRVKEIISEPLDIARRRLGGRASPDACAGCSTRSASPTTRWIATRTSSRAGSASASASPARWR